MGNCWSMNPSHDGSTPSSLPPMEPSRPLADSVPPPLPMDAIQSIREMHNKIDPIDPVDSIHPTMKPSHTFPVDFEGLSPFVDDMGSIGEIFEKIDLVEPIEPFKRFKSPVDHIETSKRFKSSESMNPGQSGCTPSSPPTMEPSQPSPVDSVRYSLSTYAIESTRSTMESSQSFSVYSQGSSPSMDAIESMRPTMKPFQPSLVDSVGASSSTYATESLREMYENIVPDEQIDRLMSFVENQLQKMNTPSEAGSSSSEGWLETIRDSTKLAAKTIDIISTEAEKLSTSHDATKEMENLTLKVLNGVGELHWVFIALSVAAFAVENYLSIGSQEKECMGLLLKIVELAKEVKQCSQQMYEREKLRNAVATIVDGAVLCADYLKRRTIFRFWSDKTAAAQLEKTNQQLGKHYGSGIDVFLGHSGRQKNFVRQLHRDLTREHVSCFFDEDDKSLPLAQKFPPLIFKAAETCKIAVVVLSKDFICSKWPMLELSAFISAMKSGKNSKLELLPIFFNISPKELSHITKDSPEWKKLVESDDTRDKWQDALKEVRSINGLQLGEDGNEVDCRDKAVKKICCFLKGINPPILLDFEPVGIEEQVREVKSLLEMDGSQSALAVIVYGFGGVGKSTVAASVVQSLDWSSSDFKFCRVAIEEKTPDKISYIIKLQTNILYNLEGFKPNLRDPLEGRFKIKEALKNKCSLLLLDNVVDKDYIQDILPKDLSFSEQKTKLRIIITSREKNVKAELNPNIMCKEYELKVLSDAASKSLLSKTILQGQVVKDKDLDEESMINEVAAACRGVPLLLSIFGKHLRVARNKESYQEVLDVLREGNLDSYRDEDLGTKLMFVYNKIKDVEVKDAFLDICTYFHGWEWNLVSDIVDFSVLDDLHRRMLVSKNGVGEVIVHDIFRLMGMKESKLTRFSNYKELSDALEENIDGFGNVKGISLVNDTGLITLQSTHLEAMHQSLRVLMLGDWVTLDGPPCHRAFRNLRYLHLGDITAFPFKDPSKLHKLRVFMNRSKPGMNLSHLPSTLKRISHVVPYVECDQFAKLSFQKLISLKSFIVETRNSVKLPEELHLPASLVHLDLSRCKNLPKDIGLLTALESLILDRSDLKCLPQGFGKLKKLKHLSLACCSKLAIMSEEFGMLSSLDELRMEDCRKLRALPESLGGLLSLRRLEVMGAIQLQLLPESLGELRIHKLTLRSLPSLHELPNSFGNMPLLKDISLISCRSLMSLPDSFVQLNMLETLNIIKCTELKSLPQDFGRLRYLKHMTIEDCHHLKELPHGFGALAALKTFTLRRCNRFVNLPKDFTELTGLEELVLQRLCLISWIPDGFGKLKRLRFLYLVDCFQLKILSDDFENMATLNRLWIHNCPEVDGKIMEKIVKQHDYMADIDDNRKGLNKCRHRQSQIGQRIAVFSGNSRDRARAIRVALLNGKYVEVNNITDQLMERSSLLVGLEEGKRATVALIMLPIQMQSHQYQTLLRFVELTRETAKTNGSSKMQIVCARKYMWRSTPTEVEERAEEESIRQILQLLPKGSCAIPSSESKRLEIITSCCDCNNYGYSGWDCYDRKDNLSFFMANVGLDNVGIEGDEFFEEHNIPDTSVMQPPSTIRKPHSNHYNSIQSFIQSLCDEDEDVVGESKTGKFIETLKDNWIDHLLVEGRQVIVDDLHGKTIGFIICNFEFLDCIKLQQIYKDIQEKHSNFLAIWIPVEWPEVCGHGTYTRFIQCMPWASFPYPHLVSIEGRKHRFVVLDKEGQIANQDALGLLLAWGVKLYPFTQYSTRESVFLLEPESCLEFLLQGMDIVGRKPIKNKMTFLCALDTRQWQWHNLKSKLEKLSQIHGNFEVLHVGKWVGREMYNLQYLKQYYEDATQNMSWPSLSFLDMIMFWYRCEYLVSKERYGLNTNLKSFANELYSNLLVMVDNDGQVVTGAGHDVVQTICESDEISKRDGMAMRVVKDEVMKSLSRGEFTSVVKTFFRHEIYNLPQHPQHRIVYSRIDGNYRCDLCDVGFRVKLGDWNERRSYMCTECTWKMCGNCWMAIYYMNLRPD